MKNFSIEMYKAENSPLMGSIKIKDFNEDFEISLSYWHREKYLTQWIKGLERIIRGSSSSALITSMHDPKTKTFIFWWVMYRENNIVFIQNHVLFLDDINCDFNEKDIYLSIPVRECFSEEGEKISEWSIEVIDLDACLNDLRLKLKAGWSV